MKPHVTDKSIVLFDGVCNLCNSSVDFIIKRDKKDTFRFAALQWGITKNLVDAEKLNWKDSIVLLENGQEFFESDAALRIAKKLAFPWNLFYAGIIIPKSFRDFVYRWIAKNRYKIFGKRETCRIPTEQEQAKFVE